MECSASSSFGSYPGYFGTGKSPEITISGQETSLLDELTNGHLKPQQQFTDNNIIPYIPSLQNDLNHHQTLPLPLPLPPVFNFPMNQREYHMNGFFEAPPPGASAYNNITNQARFGSSNSSSLPCSISMLDEYLFSQVKTKKKQKIVFCFFKHSTLLQWFKMGLSFLTWFYIRFYVLTDAATELRERERERFDEWWYNILKMFFFQIQREEEKRSCRVLNLVPRRSRTSGVNAAGRLLQIRDYYFYT